MIQNEIDITDLVEKMRLTFVTLETDAAFAALSSVSGMQWVTLPLVSDAVKALIRAIINPLSNRAVMGAFFLNTALRKASEAKEYIKAVNDKESLQDVTDQEYEAAERAEIAAFNQFVRITS